MVLLGDGEFVVLYSGAGQMYHAAHAQYYIAKQVNYHNMDLNSLFGL